MIVLANVPVPLPSVVWLPVIVGFGELLQQTPRAVTAAPPSELTVPPLDAEVAVNEDISEVTIVASVIELSVRLLFFWQLKATTATKNKKDRFFKLISF